MRAPKHATVVSYLALFVALSGSAYAATGGNFILGHANKANQPTSLSNTGSGPALKLGTAKGSTPPLAVSNGTRIANLNADKLDGLHASAFERTASPISASTISGSGVQAAGAAGPWSFTLTCAPGSATFTVHGPGTVAAANSVAYKMNAAATYIDGAKSIGSGYDVIAISDDSQSRETLFLQSGSTIVQVDALMTEVSGLFTTCSIVGGAIPVSP